MKLEIDWRETSTKRGAILVSGFVVGSVFVWFGKDPAGIILLAQGLAGGFGLLVRDQ